MKNKLINEQIKRQTKIVATIGPATHEVPMLKKMIEAGINVARLNMSHGDHKEHGERIKNIRKACSEMDTNLGILLDLSGPKIRTGEVEGESINLVEGKKIILTTKEVVSNGEVLTIHYKDLIKEARVGGFVMIDDGRRKLLVEKVEKDSLICKIIIGGNIRGRRGVNFPGAYLSISSITEKDKEDLKFGIKNKVDYIALSFVRTGEDVRTLKSLFPKNFNPVIISKIETEEALEKIDEILDESDGIMIARGDLAIEIPKERVPVIQKMLINKAKDKRKLIITATQMLESMINSPVPTRAEVSDIANAIFDGTDAVMLSEESAKGDFPVEAVRIMVDVSENTDPFVNNINKNKDGLSEKGIFKIYSSILSEKMDIKLIVSITRFGATPKTISSCKGTKPIVTLTYEKSVVNKLLAYRGIWPIYKEKGEKSSEDLRKTVKNILTSKKLVKKGDEIIVVISGTKFEKGEENNSILLETI